MVRRKLLSASDEQREAFYEEFARLARFPGRGQPVLKGQPAGLDVRWVRIPGAKIYFRWHVDDQGDPQIFIGRWEDAPEA